MFFVGQSNFLQALGWAVLNSLWQMALIWIIYQLISGLFKTARPSHKSSLATGLIIAGFAWFAYTFFSILAVNKPGDDLIAAGLINTTGNERLNTWLNTMLPVASMIYLALLILPVFYFIRNYRYVQAIRKFELSKVDVEWRMFVRNVAARMGIKKTVRVWLSGIVTSPVTIGYFKPVILIPIAAINQLTPQQLEAVLLHELAHIRRYDYLLNLVIRFIQSILYFNPFVKSLVKTVEREREKSCDEMVIQFQYDPHGYATALLMLEKVNHMPKTLAVAASGAKNDLLNRIECVLGIQKKNAISFNKLAGVFAGLLCFIALNALLIISKPEKNESETVASLTQRTSPFYFFSESEEEAAPETLNKEIPANAIVNHIQQAEQTIEEEKEQAEIIEKHKGSVTLLPHVMPSGFTYVNFFEPAIIPQLKSYQEEQLKQALEASKKVIEEKQWKVMEGRIADALTAHEKDLVKDQYEKELSKLDWKKLEDKMRLAYDKIDWSSVNEQLNKAITEIKIDSLQQAYTVTMSQLTSLQKQLCENNLKGIPDSDISLKHVEQSKKDVQQAINQLKQVKVKKIVHL